MASRDGHCFKNGSQVVKKFSLRLTLSPCPEKMSSKKCTSKCVIRREKSLRWAEIKMLKHYWFCCCSVYLRWRLCLTCFWSFSGSCFGNHRSHERSRGPQSESAWLQHLHKALPVLLPGGMLHFEFYPIRLFSLLHVWVFSWCSHNTLTCSLQHAWSFYLGCVSMWFELVCVRVSDW